MTAPVFRNWQSVQQEVRRRIHAREWKPGDLIPNEADLALEFGCARATVNRALRSVADSGLLDRRRKAGTRVALQPVAKAVLDISIIRREVEDRGALYGYLRLERAMKAPPAQISAAMKLPVDQPMLHVVALHLADERPYSLEDRWINTAAVAQAINQPFDTISSNEWLLANAAYTHGQIALSAAQASETEASRLDCPAGSALFVMERLTWDNAQAVTRVRLIYPPGHQLRTGL